MERGTTLISLNRVGVCYRRRRGLFGREPFWALSEATLEIRSGMSLGVIGRNGAGKTTLLRLLAGVIIPDRGRIENRGATASLLHMNLGFVPYLTGRQNARLSGLLLGLTRAEIEERLDAIIDFAELGDFFDQPIGTYSAGMKTRLGFSVALQIDPDILLIDEVLGVGDAGFREKSATALRERIRSDKTVLLASHDGRTIAELCDHAVWIEDGQTRAEGETGTILDQYESFWRERRNRSGRTDVRDLR